MPLTATERLVRIRKKIERADHHIRDLDAMVGAFRAEPDIFIAEKQPESGEVVYRIKPGLELPDDFSCLIGDAVHNLRTALDHLVWHLVDANPATPKVPYKRQEFPFYKSRDDYKTQGSGKIEGVPQGAVDLIDQAKPYLGGNDNLWAVYDLDRIDKHQLLIVTGLTHCGTEFTTPQGARARFPFTHTPRILEHGAEFSRVISFKYRSGVPVNVDAKPLFDIAFAEHRVVGCQPVVPFLKQSSQFIDGFVGLFLPYL